MSATAPRASFSVIVTEEDYRAAARVASLFGGRLRDAWVGFALCAALTFTIAGALVAYPWVAMLLALVGTGIAVVTLCFLYHLFRRTVTARYAVFSALFSTVQITLWEDTLDYEGNGCSRQESYALFSRLAESRRTFVLLREDGTFLVIPKADMSEETAAFLRTTFARKYRRVR